jgi:hypothetical protein
MYNIVMYYYVLIVFSLRRESLKLILATDPFRGGSVTRTPTSNTATAHHGSCGCHWADPPYGRVRHALPPVVLIIYI